MARSIDTILQQLKDLKTAQPNLADLTSASNVSNWQLLLFIYATELGIEEQFRDELLAEIESLVAKAGAGTLPWIRDRILEFQAGDNVQYSNGVIAYPTVDTTKQIITRCSVTQDTNRTIKAKVAKSDPPVALSTSEQTELDFYLQQIRFAGTQINIVSGNSDKLYLEGTIYYDGQYASTISNDVITALNNYCSNLSSATNFNGVVLVKDIEAVIVGVTGVKDLNITQVAARADGTAWASRTIIYNLSGGVNNRSYETYSGYIVQETDTGHTFADKLTFTAS